MVNETYDKQTGASPADDEAVSLELDELAGQNKMGEDTLAGESPDESSDSEGDADETTGASPGTAQACTDLGLSSLQSNLKRFNIKPPGVA